MKQMGMNFSESSSDEEDLKKQEDRPQVYSVSDLNGGVRRILEAHYPLIWVKGEISNFTAHSSGHFYFSLKDKKSQVSAVMFRGHNSRLKFRPKSGMEVLVRGKITVYEPRGNYQLFCELMEPVGAGAMQQQFEDLKNKLHKEGLFDQSLKKPLPSFPKHIAVVTSPTGAAIRDIINVLKRRNRTAQVTVIPAVVQGAGAPKSVVEAICKAQRLSNVDVLIVGRGGGSMEDLWGFNDESVARAIVACEFPVVSAVGHEVDYTIADFVSDLRAPTPSAAAELVVKNVEDLVIGLRSLNGRLTRSAGQLLKHWRTQVQALESRLIDPQRQLQQRIQRVDELNSRLVAACFRSIDKEKSTVKYLRQKLGSPKQILLKEQSRLERLGFQMRAEMTRSLDAGRRRWNKCNTMLDAISPLKVVDRGYSIATYDGEVLKEAVQVAIGDEVDIRLARGALRAKVTQVHKSK